MAVIEPSALSPRANLSLSTCSTSDTSTLGPVSRPLFPVTPVPYATAKRILDVIGASILILFFAPLMLAAAALIKLTSRGPVFFFQTRIGVGGKPFTCFKFRSMFVDADARKDDLLQFNELSGPVFKMKNDPRVTPIGRFLRKASLDELPQLFNVLRGDMSLVGPRPPVPREVEQYGPRERMRLSVKPGITCIWQVSGRCDISFERWVELDLMYIESMSLRLDVELLLRTIPAVLTCRGAH